MNRWLLPEDIADVLPARARKIEELRRRSLDLGLRPQERVQIVHE